MQSTRKAASVGLVKFETNILASYTISSYIKQVGLGLEYLAAPDSVIGGGSITGLSDIVFLNGRGWSSAPDSWFLRLCLKRYAPGLLLVHFRKGMFSDFLQSIGISAVMA